MATAKRKLIQDTDPIGIKAEEPSSADAVLPNVNRIATSAELEAALAKTLREDATLYEKLAQ